MDPIRLLKMAALSAAVLFLSSCSVLDAWRYPAPRGVYHTVTKGQTLFSISQAYGVKVRVLTRVNGLQDPTQLRAGRHLWIPGVDRVLHVPPTVGYAQKETPSGKQTFSSKKKPLSKRAARKAFAKYLIWPVDGVITSRFGPRGHSTHEGIDIGAQTGSPVFAAADGRVKFSGWGPTGYGRMVIIKHPNHLTTVYAHNSKNLVEKGQQVTKGQIIAKVGATGRASGPHLHFEVRNDTHPKDPLLYLP
ncbi:LysM peptidoglycan-binding domain-containing M23 family metallopeptidase [Nitrospina watsonii]|uniref:Peptidase M23B n=1 Tax=Nitrospina watsonii TaxID=1323948 RepID=A0ABM9HH76_9BACT|nr:M23 family metallopeptidase [Nitrospina watsonii]CAI2719572.1 Peptidase M23B [Nitrospina watsonii]